MHTKYIIKNISFKIKLCGYPCTILYVHFCCCIRFVLKEISSLPFAFFVTSLSLSDSELEDWSLSCSCLRLNVLWVNNVPEHHQNGKTGVTF